MITIIVIIAWNDSEKQNFKEVHWFCSSSAVVEVIVLLKIGKKEGVNFQMWSCSESSHHNLG